MKLNHHNFLLIITIFFSTVSYQIQAQDSLYARKIVDTLTSKTFWGRGYTKNGLENASEYLAKTFKEIGLMPGNKKSYYQYYEHSVNTFPGDMNVIVNGKELTPGKDYIISAESKSAKASGKLEQVDSLLFIDKQNAVMFKLEDKLTMTVSKEVADYSLILVDRKKVGNKVRNYDVKIENKFIKKFRSSNICGYVKGTLYPDSVLMITAHYDHLGGMGENTYFPGANDNASGVSLLLNLAKYYAKNPAPYTIYFVLFSGEEAGLLGSKYFTENPLVNLSTIKFLLNTDLAGTGIDGITVVNATIYPKQFKIMQDINTENKLLKSVNPRGKAQNSDHYYFTEKSVPSFFFYTLGGIKAYHDVNDISRTLPLTVHENLMKLVILFNQKLMEK